VIAALPSSLQTLYNGYPTTVYKSAFASWKPKSTSNKTVGFLLSETNNGYQLALAAILEGMLKGAGYTVDAVTSSDEVTDQVADFNQMVEKKVAMIVYEPLSSTAFTTAVSTAAAADVLGDLGGHLRALQPVVGADGDRVGAGDRVEDRDRGDAGRGGPGHRGGEGGGGERLVDDRGDLLLHQLVEVGDLVGHLVGGGHLVDGVPGALEHPRQDRLEGELVAVVGLRQQEADGLVAG
jgi:hypothetical protein